MRPLQAALKRYFLTGLLVITPIWGTVLILKTLFVAVDGILGDLVANLITPGSYVPGLGIVALILLILSAGVFTTNVIGHRIVRWWDAWLHRVPVVRGIYSTIKSMMDVLSAGDRGNYRRVVLIQFPKNGHYCFAFVTGATRSDAQAVSRDPLVNVYVPTSPNPTSGYFLLVPEKEVTAIDITVEEAMKLIVSGGLYTSEGQASRGEGGSRWSHLKIKQPGVGTSIG
ncbi:hypothetical protein YTPLAS18_24770 [Nitrospira sp.]|nr:hypothetical protein YTPLAS18_24770 [Nitrospira sp.]